MAGAQDPDAPAGPGTSDAVSISPFDVDDDGVDDAGADAVSTSASSWWP
jgi:hypothetical protein